VRGLAVAGLLALAGCNPGITPQNQAAPLRNESRPAPTAANQAAPAVPANVVESAREAPPDPSGMSPYRRREYDRGYRDCMTGHFDPERQGESYRIGCMAAEDAKQRR
jgi:hypothetical protein